MFTKYKCMNVLYVYASVIGQTSTQTCGIQYRTRTHDLLRAQTGNLDGFIGQYVNRIADYDVVCIRCIFCDFRHNRSHNLCIGLTKIDSGLSRLSSNTNCNDNQIGIHCIRVITILDLDRRTECSTLHDIHCFALCLILIDVNQNHFRTKALQSQCKGNRCTYISCTQNCNLLTLFDNIFHVTYPPNFILTYE